MSDKVFRWGFIGAGKMARNMANDLLLTERSQVYAVAAKTPQSAVRLAEQFGAQVTYPSVDELVQDPQVDVVYISTPNNLHYQNARAAIEAGKPVLLEKPFTLNAQQAKDLVQLAKAGNVFLMEAMWIRFLPVIVKLREILAQGQLGEIQLLKAAFHLHLDFSATHRVYNPQLGGGALLDLGIYPLSMASLIFGAQPSEIASLAKIGNTGVDEHFGTVFHYPSDAMSLASAAVDGEHPQDVLIYGTKGHVRLHAHRAWKFSRMTVAINGQTEEEFDLPYLGSGYSYQAQELIACLERGQPESKVMPLAETIAIMETLDRLRAQWGLQYPGE